VGHELAVIISVSAQVVLMDHEPHLMSVFDQASGAPSTRSAHPARAGDRDDRPGYARIGGDQDTAKVQIGQHGPEPAQLATLRLDLHLSKHRKANKPTLLHRLHALPWAQVEPAARERGRRPGRVETRTISVVSLQPCSDRDGEWFPHAAQAIKLVRRRRRPLRPAPDGRRDHMRDHEA
jgi:hypothetical protein